MKWTIDRFEGKYAVAECNNNYFNIPKNILPEGIKEGDIINVSVDKAETSDKKENLQNRLNKLFGE